ncbi:hypothetical protein M514_20279 [Trichuris suis]|uniref:Uncharacterized protein n=2 Tax=Trichuris suis TaxID=68888 RepID=A0A085LNG8_9BILA|nr:hypothetical protein M513_12599 [Trichuris suis]KFD55710.1 hypothetical protein M513_03458 [Trichuris suis]KFD67602.1 hypothetical protein M514_20279 [Trichuris suis]
MSSNPREEEYAKWFQEGQSRAAEFTSLAQEGLAKFDETLRIIEEAGGEGVFERSPIELTSGSCVPFPAVNQVLKSFEAHYVPGKKECLAEFPKILAAAQGAQSISELAEKIGGNLLPTAVWIGYKAHESETIGKVLIMLEHLTSTLDPNMKEVRDGIEHISKQLAEIQSDRAPGKIFNNREHAYIERLAQIQVTTTRNPVPLQLVKKCS